MGQFVKQLAWVTLDTGLAGYGGGGQWPGWEPEEEHVQGFERKVRRSFGRQGFMRTIGARMTAVGRGTVEIQLPFSEKLSQQRGFVHGAAITAILDSACGFAALSVAPPEAEVLSVEFKVNFVAPAVGERFIARGAVKRNGKTLSVCTGDVFAVAGKQEKLVATMLTTIINTLPGNNT